jgi:hypothetical protein
MARQRKPQTLSLPTASTTAFSLRKSSLAAKKPPADIRDDAVFKRAQCPFSYGRAHGRGAGAGGAVVGKMAGGLAESWEDEFRKDAM